MDRTVSAAGGGGQKYLIGKPSRELADARQVRSVVAQGDGTHAEAYRVGD